MSKSRNGPGAPQADVSPRVRVRRAKPIAPVPAPVVEPEPEPALEPEAAPDHWVVVTFVTMLVIAGILLAIAVRILTLPVPQ